MSNPKGKKRRVEFPRDHARLSPRSEDELYALEPEQVRGIIQRLYDNKPLYTQFGEDAKRSIRKVNRYREEGAYVPDEVLFGAWGGFLRNVLIPMENAWEAELLSRRIRDTDSDLQYNLALLEHRGYSAYRARRRLLGEDFDALTASSNEAREGLRWCDAYLRVLKPPGYELFCKKHERLNLTQCTVFQLRAISRRIGELLEKKQLATQLQQEENWQNLVRHDPDFQLEDGQELEDLPIGKLHSMKKAILAMRAAGVSYDHDGIVAVTKSH